MNNRTLSWEEFDRQCGDERIILVNRGHAITSLVIRSGGGFDYGVSAVHREPGPDGDILVFDMGHSIKEIT